MIRKNSRIQISAWIHPFELQGDGPKLQFDSVVCFRPGYVLGPAKFISANGKCDAMLGLAL